MSQTLSRRRFTQIAAASTVYSLIPGRVLGANEKLDLAIIGCSHQGGGIGKNAMAKDMANCVALCDVLPSRTGGFKKKYPDAKVYDDFRKMFDEMGDKINACTIGVPDHAHFPIAMLAMSKGISVYVEKPLAHTFEECELLMAAEKKYKVACQMGNQGHSGSQRLQFEAWVEGGIIKNVKKIDAYMNNGRRWHPWGNVTGFPPADPMPEGMNWDVWTGTAPMHDYNAKKLDNGNWRGWHVYGDGAFGDWGPHTLDSSHRFLKLGLPYEVRADKLEGRNDFIFPMASTIAFEFAARGEMPPITVNWYDGVKNKPPRPKELDEKRKVPSCGKTIYGEDLVFMGGTHSSALRIVPETKMREMGSSLPKAGDGTTNKDHMKNFLLAAMGKEECNSKFSVAAPLCQMFALGCIAQHLGGVLKFDAETKRITNNSRANELLALPPRKGWEEFYKL